MIYDCPECGFVTCENKTNSCPVCGNVDFKYICESVVSDEKVDSREYEVTDEDMDEMVESYFNMMATDITTFRDEGISYGEEY